VLCFLNGLVVGLSVPGIEMWYLAWVGLAPFLVLLTLSKRLWQASLRGLIFGFGYNLVGMHWLLGLAPLDWLGFTNWQGMLLASAALVIVALHQSLLVSVFAFAYRLLPLHAGLLPYLQQRRIYFPALWTVPLVWVLSLNKLGSLPIILGMPWGMLEYSQYRQLPIIQASDTIGGIGLGYVMLMVNVFLALLILKSLPLEGDIVLKIKRSFNTRHHFAVVSLILTVMIVYGDYRLSCPLPATINTAILQPNVNIEMQKTRHRFSLDELVAQEVAMIEKVPPGFCVMTESALPTRLGQDHALQSLLAKISIRKQIDILVGAIDCDRSGKLYNAAFAVAGSGMVTSQVYHKRYLVPFGEYTPVDGLPEWLLRLTNTPAGAGYTAGGEPVVFRLSNGSISPLICFETISPELAAQSVRAGGALLANISDLAWFHQSVIGEQMLACAVLRAVENRRYFIFAANTGPSAIISTLGVIAEQSGKSVRDVLVGKVGLNSKISIFTRWASL